MTDDSPATGLDLYDRVARDAAASVIARYSTSFALACRMLGPRVRGDVKNIYALVRIADEIVDGPAGEAGLDVEAARDLLDDLEAEVFAAIDRRYSTNLIVHAFAATARECGIGEELIGPFFASMRTDLEATEHDAASHDTYVYGSAEVVGLMCLQAFINAGAPAPVAPDPHLVDGARRLGAAFQDVNFLRDRAHDDAELGRDYLGLRSGRSTRADVLDTIDADLAAAAAVIPSCPGTAARRSPPHTICSTSSHGACAPTGPTRSGSVYPTASRPCSRHARWPAARPGACGHERPAHRRRGRRGDRGSGHRRTARRRRLGGPAARGPR